MSSTVRAISIFSVDKASGHSVYDDIFYFNLLKKSALPFKFYASEYSIAQLAKRCQVAEGNTSPICVDRSGWFSLAKAIRTIRVSPEDRVIFLGYSETFVTLFSIVNFLKKFDLVLVATNNISRRRVRKYRIRLSIFFNLISSRLTKIVVHTDEERRLCMTFGSKLFQKAVAKKHHLMIPQWKEMKRPVLDRRTVVFFGPVKYYKPLQPMLDLIRADTEGVFEYRFVNVDTEEVLKRLEPEEIRKVEFVNRWLSKNEYFAEYLRSSFIMLSHDKSFEGKLSGNLCDCISTGVPFIASNIEPVRSYIARYGDIGCVYDLSDPKWCREFVEGYSEQRYAKQLLSLREVSRDYERSAVEEDNLHAMLA